MKKNTPQTTPLISIYGLNYTTSITIIIDYFVYSLGLIATSLAIAGFSYKKQCSLLSLANQRCLVQKPGDAVEVELEPRQDRD